MSAWTHPVAYELTEDAAVALCDALFAESQEAFAACDEQRFNECAAEHKIAYDAFFRLRGLQCP